MRELHGAAKGGYRSSTFQLHVWRLHGAAVEVSIFFHSVNCTCCALEVIVRMLRSID